MSAGMRPCFKWCDRKSRGRWRPFSSSADCAPLYAENPVSAGITSIDNNGAVIMPATIGEAMRRMISDPVPLTHMIGTRPGMILRVAQDRAQSASVEVDIDPA